MRKFNGLLLSFWLCGCAISAAFGFLGEINLGLQTALMGTMIAALIYIIKTIKDVY